MVCFEEKDVFMSKENQRELQDRLGINSVILPQVFADGQHLGVSDIRALQQCNYPSAISGHGDGAN